MNITAREVHQVMVRMARYAEVLYDSTVLVTVLYVPRMSEVSSVPKGALDLVLN